MLGLVTLSFLYLYVINSLAPYKRSMGSSIYDKINKEGNIISKPVVLDIIGPIITIFVLAIHYYYNTDIYVIDLMLLGIASTGPILRQLSYKELGKFYTFDIGIRNNHRLVTSGIYKYMAHPGYTGFLLTYVSLICFSNTYFILTIILLCATCYSFENRIKNEEKMLQEHFGDEYKEYIQKTKRFLPYLF